MITSSSPFHLCPLQAPNPSTSSRPPLRTSQCGGRPCTPRLVATPDALGPSASISEANTCSATVTDQNYVNLLQECIAKGDLSLTTKLHHQILSSHVPLHARLGNTLLNTYTKLGDLQSARQVFDEMTDRASLSWGIMMGAYLRNGEADVALELFKEMHREGIGRDHPVFVTALKSCGKLANMLDGQMVHCELVKLGLDMDSVVTSALLTMYADCGSVLEARRVFDGSTSMRSGTCVPWNAMVSGYSKNGLATESISLFVEMGVQGIQPDMYTFVSVLNTCSQLANKLMGMAVHGLVVKSGLSLDQSIVTSLIRMYAKCNCLDGTRKAFDRAKVLDITCWNSMIETYAQNGNSHSAIEALLEMQRLSGLKPNRMSFIYALNACSSPKAIELGIEIHNLAIQRKLELEVSVANALITMYAQCGNIEDAWRLFRRMPNKDIHSWNATIMGYAHRGYGKEALQIFEQMQKLGLQPDETTFVGLLVASSHVGDIERAHELLQLMRTCKISPTPLHYACIVGLLGQLGRLCDAELFIYQMPILANAMVWCPLLDACKAHGEADLATFAALNIHEMESENEKLKNCGMEMEEMLTQLKRAESSLVVENSLLGFSIDGVMEHPRIDEILTKLDELSFMLERRGFRVRPKLGQEIIRGDSDSKEFEKLVEQHIEELAVAYGLITNDSKRQTIRVFKRTCLSEDSHDLLKAVSLVSGRNIVLKDNFGFHYFKNGLCSCGSRGDQM